MQAHNLCYVVLCTSAGPSLAVVYVMRVGLAWGCCQQQQMSAWTAFLQRVLP